MQSAKMILQAKSGGVQRKDIAALRGDMERQGAALACLITLEEPTKPMKQDAKHAGVYVNDARGIRCDRIRIVRIEDLIHNNARVNLPMHPEATNKARRDIEGDQLRLDLRPAEEPEIVERRPAGSAAREKKPRSKRA
jgi:hypothetical protein